MRLVAAPRLAVLVIGLLVPASTVSADANDCRNAVSGYNTAVEEISSTLRRYTNCVSGSQGRDDCTSEFRRLRYAQDEFETAVSEYGSDCE